MSQRAIVLIGILLVAVLGAAVATGWRLGRSNRMKEFSRIQSGGKCSSGGYSVSGGNVVIDAPKPGSFFGTIARPGGTDQFSYYVLFRYDPFSLQRSSGGSTGSSSGNQFAECKNSFELNGKQVEAIYKVSFAEATQPGKGETLTLGSQSFDLSQGRVFLVDLTAGAPVYHQKNVTLPGVPSNLGSPDLKRVAEEAQQHLAKQDSEIAAFLK